jgi:hypothetical protein
MPSRTDSARAPAPRAVGNSVASAVATAASSAGSSKPAGKPNKRRLRRRDGLFLLFDNLGDIGRSLIRKHGRKLWWMHSFYALLLGASVVVYAQEGLDHARMLAVSVVLAWLIVVLFFRLFGADAKKEEAVIVASQSSFGSGAATQASGHRRVHFFVMTYVLKNLYQGMLFFLLPFYWKSATRGAANFGYVILLSALALLSTLDLFFDHVVMRRRVFASIFHGLTLFSCMNLLVPAIVPSSRAITSLIVASVITVVGFWSLHAPPTLLKRKDVLAAMLASLAAGVGLAYFGRTLIPPVPMYVTRAAVGPEVLADKRLSMEVSRLHTSAIKKLYAVTDVVVPGGDLHNLRHVWVHEGHEITTDAKETSRSGGPGGTVRLESSLSGKELPKQLVGSWYVEVRTGEDQVVGRTAFEVIE